MTEPSPRLLTPKPSSSGAFVLGGNKNTLAFVNSFRPEGGSLTARLLPLAWTPLGVVIADRWQNVGVALSSLMDWIDKTFPTDGEPGTDVFVDVAKFPDIFAADVDPGLAKVLAVGQRPLAGVAFTEKASTAAWKTKPAWGSVRAGATRRTANHPAVTALSSASATTAASIA